MLRYVAGSIAIALLAVGAPARADYEAGRKAFEAGRPAEALSEWRVAAAVGDRRAMLALGRLFLRGVGTPQDYVEAHMWFNLAAGRGAAEAAKERDALSARMTPQQIAAAQDRARSWRPGGAGQATAPEPPRASVPQPAAGGPPPRAIREAQTLLAALGYAPGPADGRWGGRTAAAHWTFLQAAGLPAADALTPETLRALRKAVEDRGGTGTSQRAVRSDAAAVAASRGDVAGLRAALAAGADVNARDGRGWTALMHAADKGYVLMVPPLLEAKADPDLRAPDGATPLFMAAVHGHSEVIAALMKAGAGVSIKGPKGKTAADAARLRYGDAGAARKKGVDPAIVALLEGKTWADAEAERRARELEERRARELVENNIRIFRKLREELPWTKKIVEISDCDGCPEMVLVPSGSFTMGSPASEKGRSVDEGPRHRVTIEYAFAVGKHEVTRGEYGRFVSETGHSSGDSCWVFDGGWKERSGYNWKNPGFEQSDDHPVACVSWNDAKSYARWLSTKTGERYRLLSEAEWEYAARAGTTGPFHAGETISTDQANYDGNYVYGGGRKGAYRRRTVPVGSFGGNSFGLHDMHGNVSEWVEDCWKGSYAGAAPSDGSAWKSGNCGRRVLRGGSWGDFPRNLRSANRHRNEAGSRYISRGFRVARTLAP